MTDTPPEPAPSDPTQAPSVEQQRQDLADTVAALAAKADVPTRVKNETAAKVEHAKATVQRNPQPVAAIAGGIVAAFIVTVLLRRRRARRTNPFRR